MQLVSRAIVSASSSELATPRDMAHAGYARTSQRRRLVGRVETVRITDNKNISVYELARCRTKDSRTSLRETLQVRESNHLIIGVDKAIVVGTRQATALFSHNERHISTFRTLSRAKQTPRGVPQVNNLVMG
jgi:hypothetical protein